MFTLGKQNAITLFGVSASGFTGSKAGKAGSGFAAYLQQYSSFLGSGNNLSSTDAQLILPQSFNQLISQIIENSSQSGLTSFPGIAYPVQNMDGVTSSRSALSGSLSPINLKLVSPDGGAGVFRVAMVAVTPSGQGVFPASHLNNSPIAGGATVEDGNTPLLNSTPNSGLNTGQMAATNIVIENGQAVQGELSTPVTESNKEAGNKKVQASAPTANSVHERMLTASVANKNELSGITANRDAEPAMWLQIPVDDGQSVWLGLQPVSDSGSQGTPMLAFAGGQLPQAAQNLSVDKAHSLKTTVFLPGGKTGGFSGTGSSGTAEQPTLQLQQPVKSVPQQTPANAGSGEPLGNASNPTGSSNGIPLGTGWEMVADPEVNPPQFSQVLKDLTVNRPVSAAGKANPNSAQTKPGPNTVSGGNSDLSSATSLQNPQPTTGGKNSQNNVAAANTNNTPNFAAKAVPVGSVADNGKAGMQTDGSNLASGRPVAQNIHASQPINSSKLPDGQMYSRRPVTGLELNEGVMENRNGASSPSVNNYGVLQGSHHYTGQVVKGQGTAETNNAPSAEMFSTTPVVGRSNTALNQPTDGDILNSGNLSQKVAEKPHFVGQLSGSGKEVPKDMGGQANGAVTEPKSGRPGEWVKQVDWAKSNTAHSKTSDAPFVSEKAQVFTELQPKPSEVNNTFTNKSAFPENTGFSSKTTGNEKDAGVLKNSVGLKSPFASEKVSGHTASVSQDQSSGAGVEMKGEAETKPAEPAENTTEMVEKSNGKATLAGENSQWTEKAISPKEAVGKPEHLLGDTGTEMLNTAEKTVASEEPVPAVHDRQKATNRRDVSAENTKAADTDFLNNRMMVRELRNSNPSVSLSAGGYSSFKEISSTGVSEQQPKLTLFVRENGDWKPVDLRVYLENHIDGNPKVDAGTQMELAGKRDSSPLRLLAGLEGKRVMQHAVKNAATAVREQAPTPEYVKVNSWAGEASNRQVAEKVPFNSSLHQKFAQAENSQHAGHTASFQGESSVTGVFENQSAGLEQTSNPVQSGGELSGFEKAFELGMIKERAAHHSIASNRPVGNSAPTAMLYTSLDEPVQMVKELARQMQGMLLRNGREMVVQLRPENLGLIRVRLQGEKEKMHARIETTTPEVQQLLQKHQTELIQRLAEQEISLENLEFSLLNSFKENKHGQQGLKGGNRDGHHIVSEEVESFENDQELIKNPLKYGHSTFEYIA